MQQSKEHVQQIFSTLDTDGNGYLELEELSKLVKELGKEISNYELKKIIKKIDINKDGKISFSEFYTWWFHGNENGMEDLVYLKMKQMKYFKKFSHKLGKMGGILADKNDLDVSDHYMGINVGEAPPKSYLGSQVLFGQEAKQLTEDLTKDFEDINENTPAVVIKIRTKDAEAAKAGFEDLLEQLMALGESLLPPEIADKYLETLKINYSIPEANYICIGITGQHELINAMIEEHVQLAQEHLPEDFVSSFRINASCGNSVKDFTDNPAQPFSEVLSQAGFNLSADLKINKQVMQKAREQLFTKMQKKHEKNEYLSGKLKKIQPFLSLFLIQGSRVNINFKTAEKVVSELGLPIPEDLPQNFGDTLEMAKELSGNPEEMLSEIPFAEDVLALFKDHCCSDISITALVPKAAAQIYATTEGINDLVTKFLGE